MASELPAEVNGINLADYFPSTRSYNSVVYVHKKFFNDHKEKAPIADISDKIENIEPIQKECKKKYKKDKLKNKVSNDEKNHNQTSVNNDEVLGQTIRFAKNIVPIVIPPNQDTSPVYYTIKTSRKSRVTKCKPRDSDLTHDLTYEKQQRKKIIETFRKEKYKSHTECYSHESVSRSSKSNTSENIIINHSLCCSFSEISEEKHNRLRKVSKKPEKRLMASESFEALATELLNTSGDANIKIHLMNDTAKDLFYASIRNPVIEAIKESVSEIITHKGSPECKVVHKYVQCHTQKLDNILDKLTCIEKKLNCADEKVKTQNVKVFKSALEEIGEDIIENEDMSEDEDVSNAYSALEQRKVRCPSGVTKLSPIQKNLEKELNIGGGEEMPGAKTSVTPKVLSDRPNRIPARYCWTDSTT
ncbi:uncharacterized protein [Choristoneura fumiferana]|uniref:uncharacterized protein n=1 Tax=Choristoneura fumiferana TaxID=7141 RepID=UPI003D15CBF3